MRTDDSTMKTRFERWLRHTNRMPSISGFRRGEKPSEEALRHFYRKPYERTLNTHGEEQ